MPTLNLPKSYPFMGGVEPAYIRDAVGTHWWSAWITGGPRGGGQYVFKQVGVGQAVEVPYGPLMTGRGLICLQPDGTLVCTGSDGKVASAFVIPGFAVHTTAGVAYIPNPVVTPVVDKDAQRLATAANVAAKAAAGVADKASKAIAAMPPVPTDQHINDLIWAKCADRIFADLSDPNSGISSRLNAIIDARMKK